MYEYMTGKLVYVGPLYVVLDIQGIGYQIYIANPFRFSSVLDEEVKVYIHQAVRDDNITLYGFKDAAEKQLYLKLISVSGIGPKSGLSILANGDHAGLVGAIEGEDVKYLTKFPGVGKKTASQIILDLKGKLNELLNPEDKNFALDTEETSTGNTSSFVKEAEEALKGLGYSVKEIDKIVPKLNKETYASTEEVLRAAFKLLLKK
ncbi:Holliday junction branch migration protein RuvA [Jeotgalibaca sp. MA1X17-3]|uniref:Holliday junction branch migration protein RuvA n=1 Tax=Jeotgalibaca sp. MA1X17-3 TaxID=2908211 RepID=UPI001F40FA70|nr:Holliday junction branch migration protein RuvA [Jeotgalibaca sp. MA1X17-3]UJF14865.1 Holliday junction branch migration protein RuvA [Jeotgalibaca sp. MA1X17-3]